MTADWTRCRNILILTWATAISSIFCFSAAAADVDGFNGFKIVTHNLQATIAPEVEAIARRTDPDDPQVMMVDADPTDELDCLAPIKHALDTYPSKFLRSILTTIVLAQDIRLWGRVVGGTQTPGLLAINCAAQNRPGITAFVHELIAAKVNNLSPEAWSRWIAGNKSTFHYGDGEFFRRELQDADARQLQQHLNAEGFVNNFGLADKTADFETYAEQAFGDGPAFAKIVAANPAMQPKLRLLIHSYLQVAPDMRDYFDRTGLAAAAGGVTTGPTAAGASKTGPGAGAPVR